MYKKISIINAYGDKNIGDAAILKVAVSFIRETHSIANISVHTESVQSLTGFVGIPHRISSYQLPYGYAISGRKRVSSFVKLSRFFEVFFNSWWLVLREYYFGKKLPQKGFYSYITDIKNADLIVGMGGGYLTSKSSGKDYFGLLLTLLPIYLAKFYKKKIVFLPMSFGPFASETHEKLALNAISGTTVISRDKITLDYIKRLDIHSNVKTFYTPDLALFLKNGFSKEKESQYIVLTARDWFSDPAEQDRYETSLSNLIQDIYRLFGLKTIFIPMARNKVEDDDNRVLKRIYKKINPKYIIEGIIPKSVEDTQRILHGAKIAICTRMHSAILSSTVGTPFITIGYGTKSLGFVKSFNLEKWYVDISDVNEKILLEKFLNLYTRKEMENFKSLLNKQISNVEGYKKKIIQELN